MKKKDPKPTLLKLDLIRLDGGTQQRAQLKENTVREYLRAMKDGAVFPPVVVFFDGTSYWLAAGFHRLEATRRNGLTEIRVEIREGTLRDAILFACGENAAHGLHRSPADKRRAVQTLLNDPEWSQWSGQEIARQCRVSHTFVEKIKKTLTGNVASEPGSQAGPGPAGETRKFTTKYGTQAEMKVGNIGKRKAKKDQPEQGRVEVPNGPPKTEEEPIQSGWQSIVGSLLGLADKQKQHQLVLDLLALFGQHFPAALKAAAKTAKEPPKEKEPPKPSEPDLFEQAEGGGVSPDLIETTPQEDKPAKPLPAVVEDSAPTVTTKPAVVETPPTVQTQPPTVVEQPTPAVTLTEQLPSQAEPLAAELLSEGGPSGTEEPEWAVEVVEEAEDTIMATGETELLKKLNTERYILNEVMREHGISWPVETDNNDRHVWRKYDYDPLHRVIEEDRRKREESRVGTPRKAG